MDDVTVPATPAVLKVGAIKGITGMGGATTDIDISNMDSIVKEFAKGLLDGGSPSFDIIFDPQNAGHGLLNSLSTLGTGAVKQWYFGFSDGTGQLPTLVGTAPNQVLTAPGATKRSGLNFDAFVKQFQIDAAADGALMGKCALKTSGAYVLSKK
jgi:hypothetical protein